MASLSPFALWQFSRRLASLEELERMHPGTIDTFALEEAPPDAVLLYEGDAWLLVCSDPAGSYFRAHIESRTYVSEELEELELLLFEWLLP